MTGTSLTVSIILASNFLFRMTDDDCSHREETTTSPEPSLYMQELTRYISNIMNTVLLGLPPSIKELLYFETLAHASTIILSLPLSPTVKRLSPAAVAKLYTDAQHLADFVSSLGTITPQSTIGSEKSGPDSTILLNQIDPLRQTVELMRSKEPEEFYDASARSRKYGSVDRMNGAILLEKVHEGREIGQGQGQGGGEGDGVGGVGRQGGGVAEAGKGLLTGRERLGNMVGKRFGMNRDEKGR